MSWRRKSHGLLSSTITPIRRRVSSSTSSSVGIPSSRSSASGRARSGPRADVEPVELEIVEDDEAPVARRLNVELDVVGTELDRPLERGQGVLLLLRRRAPVRDHPSHGRTVARRNACRHSSRFRSLRDAGGGLVPRAPAGSARRPPRRRAKLPPRAPRARPPRAPSHPRPPPPRRGSRSGRPGIASGSRLRLRRRRHGARRPRSGGRRSYRRPGGRSPRAPRGRGVRASSPG